MSDELRELLRLARLRWDAMTPEQQEAELRAQRDSWVRGEMGMGSDADEARYRADVEAGRDAELHEDVRRNGT